MAIVKNIVQQTTDYDQFKFLSSNRDQSRGHIEALKTAFDEVGNLSMVQPILVNDQMQIIDGQHRFTACQELGLPIFFTIVPGLGIAEARGMNILHRVWTTDDFAKSYAVTGDQNYQKYLTLKEDYDFPHSVMLAYIEGSNRRGMFKEFRTGDFVLKDEVGARERLNKLATVGEHTTLARNIPFAIALLRSFDVEGYDHNRMLKKLSLHADRLKKLSVVEDNARQLEDLYNYMQPENTRLRLY